MVSDIERIRFVSRTGLHLHAYGVLYLWKLHPKCNTDENIWIMAILLRIHNLVNIIARYFKILWKISILSPNHLF